MSSESINNHAAFIWSVADLLRGDYKQSEYGKVILPLTVLRRLDAVIAPVKQDMLDKYESTKAAGIDNHGPVLDRLTKTTGVWNTSKYDITKLLDDSDNIASNLRAYIAGFSEQIRDVLSHFDIDTQVARLDKANLLYLVIGKFAEIDLHPDNVSNLEMGYLYEELIRRFSELSNETAGEHFTPREVIELMVNLLFIDDDELLSKPGIVKTMLDPACGTGGMLSIAENHLRQLNPQATLTVFGQELNPETYATCRSDMMLKGQNAENIAYGNSFSEDGHTGKTFDYLLANPPFGVEWKKVKEEVTDEHENKGFSGRFGAGLPRINDGSFLFLQHMISKMKRPEDGGSRLAIVFNGSPLFTGAAGSGESEIRRWIIENDWLEAVVALPDQLFYNTGISTYFWIVTNRKDPKRKGKVQLLDARNSFTKMRKSLGEKRKQISEDDIAEIVRTYGAFEEHKAITDETTGTASEVGSKIFSNESFGFMRITVERPLKLRFELTSERLAELAEVPKFAAMGDEEQHAVIDYLRPLAENDLASRTTFEALRESVQMAFNKNGVRKKAVEKAVVEALTVRDEEAPAVLDKKGNPEPDSDLRDNENVSLPNEPVRYEQDPTGRLASDTYRKTVVEYVEAEVHPYAPDAWVDQDKTKLGYEIPLTRHFYVYTPPRPLEEIDAEIKQLETEIHALLDEVTE